MTTEGVSGVRRPKILFLVEGFTDIRFVSGLDGVCDLTMVVPAGPFRSSKLDERMRDEGLGTPVFELPGGRLAYQARSFAWLWRNLRGFDAILCQELLRGTLNATLVGRAKGVPAVATMMLPAVEYFRCRRERRLSGPVAAFAGESVIKSLLHVNGRLVARCMALGPYLLDVARRYCPWAEPGHYYGVDLARFRPADAEERRALRARFGLPQGIFLVLFASRMSHEKDPETALRAVAGIRARGTDSAILNLGGGFKDFVALAAQLGLPESERWVLGRAAVHPLRELADYFRCVDAVCQASLEEGLSLSTHEALACGTPVAATAVGGMAVALPGRARLAPRRDVGAMTDALWGIARDAAGARAQALSARPWVEMNSSRETAFRSWRRVFEEMAARPRGRGAGSATPV